MKLEDMDEELKWQLFEAPESEINKEEVRMKLLQYDFDGACQRVIINPEAEEENIITYTPKRSSTIMRIAAFGIAAVAVFIISFEVTNRAKSVIADPDTGFFHWLQKDHTGITFVTSPQPEISGVTPSALDMDPELVSKAFYVPDGMPPNMLLNSISYLPGEDNYKYYYTNGTQYLEIGSVPRRGYDAEAYGYEYNVSMITHNNMADFWLKEKECLGTYPYDGRIYYIKGNFDVEKIIEMTDGMAGYLKAPKEEAADEE